MSHVVIIPMRLATIIILLLIAVGVAVMYGIDNIDDIARRGRL